MTTSTTSARKEKPARRATRAPKPRLRVVQPAPTAVDQPYVLHRGDVRDAYTDSGRPLPTTEVQNGGHSEQGRRQELRQVGSR